MDAIYISIAAYRDPQLIPTVEDCLARAARPERLRFGICWQHSSEELALPWTGDSRFRILDVDWRSSQGACWARAELMKLYAGERYFLQLDSHHRFAADWDERAIDQLRRTGSPKPVLTTYAPAFDPQKADERTEMPTQMTFDRFTEDGIVLCRADELSHWQARDRPARARFLSAHFLFTIGEFVSEVPYDPELYFHGEEISLAVRAFTHGYDLFHPIETIVWHEHGREHQHKHWTDHLHGEVEIPWYLRDRRSLDKVQRLLERSQDSGAGLGRVRAVEEYEAYAGLSFTRRRAQDYTRQGHDPPNPPAPADWVDRVKPYRLDLSIDKTRLPVDTDCRFWYFGVHDASRTEIFRQDLDSEEIRTALENSSKYVTFHRQFETESQPVSWTVWPMTESGVWLEPVSGTMADLKPVTLVTALMDIDRGTLTAPFSRSFADHYLVLLEHLLAIDLPMTIFVEPQHEALVWRHRDRSNTAVTVVQRSDLAALPWFERVQEIRTRPDWRSQTSWLPESPQAALPYYNPLVLSKMRWLDRVARDNPFETRAAYWIDVGLLNTVPGALLAAPPFASRLLSATGDFLWVARPTRQGSETDGFPPAALAERAAVARASRRVKSALFGGLVECVPEVARLYEQELTETLRRGLMGTEESLFTILAYRHRELFTEYRIDPDGLMTPFFVALAHRSGSPQDDGLLTVDGRRRRQQHLNPAWR